MSLAVETEKTEQGATLMASPEIKYVSLVEHAANREPFRGIKSEIGGEDSMGGSIVQRIIAPAGTDLIAVLKEEGIEFDGDISTATKAEHEGFDIYTQVDVTKFDSDSFQMKKASEKNDSILVVTGTLKSSPEQAVTSVAETEVKSDLESPLNTTIVEASVESTYYGMYISTTTAMDALDDELWNFSRAVYAIGNAAGMEDKARLKAIVALIDGFKTFVTNLMSFVSTDTTTKSESESESPKYLEKLNSMLSVVNTAEAIAIKHEVINMKPEEITALVTKAVSDGLASATKADADATMAELSAKMDALTKEVEALKAEKGAIAEKADETAKKLEAVEAEKADLEKKVADMEGTPEVVPATKAEVNKVSFSAVVGKKADGFECFDSLFARK